MHDLVPDGQVVLLVASTLLVALGSSRLAEWALVPAPALFLVAAAIVSHVVPQLGTLDIVTNQRIVTVALVLILFDGGMHIGWKRMRSGGGRGALARSWPGPSSLPGPWRSGCTVCSDSTGAPR